MTTPKRQITRDDIMALDAYEKVRAERKKQIAEIKQNRRVGVGPDATFYFESYDTMWMQIHEMLRIEKGGDEQLADELRAYNPLIPNGRDLVATFMFEIDDPNRRARMLAELGHVEETIYLTVGEARIHATLENDTDRTDAQGRTSSVHFLHFPFTDDEAAAFKRPGAKVTISIEHPKYGHSAVLREEVRAALAGDLD